MNFAKGLKGVLLFGVSGKLLTSIGQLLLLPQVYAIYGKENLGVFSLFLTLVSLTSFFSFGIPKAILTLLPPLKVQSQHDKMSKVYSDCFILLFFLVSFSLSLLFLFRNHILNGIELSNSDVYIYKFYYVFLLSLFLYTFLSFFEEGANVTDNLSKVKAIETGVALFSLSIAYLFAFLNYEIVVVYFILSVLSPFLRLFLVLLFCGSSMPLKNIFSFSFKGERRSFRLIVGVAFGLLCLQSIQLFTFGLDSYYISKFDTLDVTAEFSILNRVFLFFMFFLALLSSYYWPKISAEKDCLSKLKIKFNFAVKINVIFSLSSALFFYYATPIFINIFFHEGFIADSKMFLIMSLMIFVNSQTSLLVLFLNALSLLRYQMIFGSLGLALKVTFLFSDLYEKNVYSILFLSLIILLIFYLFPLYFILVKYFKRENEIH